MVIETGMQGVGTVYLLRKRTICLSEICTTKVFGVEYVRKATVLGKRRRRRSMQKVVSAIAVNSFVHATPFLTSSNIYLAEFVVIVACEVDLVHCGASMYAVGYEYNRVDFFAQALQKVIEALQ